MKKGQYSVGIRIEPKKIWFDAFAETFFKGYLECSVTEIVEESEILILNNSKYITNFIIYLSIVLLIPIGLPCLIIFSPLIDKMVHRDSDFADKIIMGLVFIIIGGLIAIPRYLHLSPKKIIFHKGGIKYENGLNNMILLLNPPDAQIIKSDNQIIDDIQYCHLAFFKENHNPKKTFVPHRQVADETKYPTEVLVPNSPILTFVSTDANSINNVNMILKYCENNYQSKLTPYS